ncbi:AsmA family protein [Bordetella genomosp. 13]|uniref:AsmA family protein n=1 Tax=Bordetella genomosp. 13 TaxID=463040 RepID=A0A1W6ZGE1_9BORD|nr:AsmA family protein [Bordetella genomosp. 13]ARP96409.1 AsmA family protein [Bordetella genomosp. 13]
MTRKKKVFLGVLATLAVLVVAAVIVVATLDWNRFKPTINARVSEAIGRPFAINGDLSVAWRREPDETGWRGWVPWPRVTAEDITVGNTEWARKPVMASLQRAEFSLSPVPLLARRVVIRHIQLTGPAADLQRMADGRANWVFTMPESGGEPSPWEMDIDQVGFDKGVIGYLDEVQKADVQVQIDPLGKPIPFAELAGKAAEPADKGAQKKESEGKRPRQEAADEKAAQAGRDKGGKSDGADADEDGMPDDANAKALEQAERAGAVPRQPPRDYRFAWQVEGRYKDLPVKGEGRVGGLLALRNADEPFPVQADVSVGRTRATAVGTLTDPMRLGALNLQMSLSGSSMAHLYPLIGVALPDTPPYSTDGRLIASLQNAGGAVFEYRRFNGKVGQSDLHGSLRFTTQPPRPKLVGRLRSDQLRMVDLGPLIGVQPESAQKAAAKSEKSADEKQASGKVLPTQEFRTERWRSMDADVRFAGGRIIHGSKLPLSDLDTHVVMEDGKLTLDPLRFGMAGGSIGGTVSLDGSRTPMGGRVHVRARSLKLRQLFPQLESMESALGQMHGEVALAGRGNSVAALLGTADGEVRMLVNDGVISRSLMEIAGLNVGNYLVTKMFGDDEVHINCTAADLGMKNGLMQTRAFVIDTDNAVVTIDGSVNFKDESMDLDISPESKGFRVFSLRSPLYVQGTFANPKAGVQTGPLLARGAGMVALGVVLTPAAGLLALIAPSSDEPENQCSSLLAEARKPAKAPASK